MFSAMYEKSSIRDAPKSDNKSDKNHAMANY